MGTEIVRSVEPRSASTPAAESISPATDCIPASRSTPSISQPPLAATVVADSVGCCTACGRYLEPLHRLKQDDAVRNFCSSCILFLYKGMYCCVCFVVYENSVVLSDPALWLTCTKCQRISHLACAHEHNVQTDSVFFTCRDCSKLEQPPIEDTCTNMQSMAENGSPPLKKLRLSSDRQISPNEVLAAAHIVAFLAVKQAKDAKAKARALAGVAASAAARAKAALDIAHRVALEEARWKPESAKQFPGVLPVKNRGLPSSSLIAAQRTSRVDGRVSMPHLSHVHPHSHSQKDPLGKELTSLGYAPRFSGQYNKLKTFPPSAESIKPSSSSQNALPRTGLFQKLQAVCMQGGLEHSPLIESKGAIVSASPASILDASPSLDTPHLNSSIELGSAHVNLPESIGKTNASSMSLTRSDPAEGSSQLPDTKDQAAAVEKGAEEASVSTS